MESQGPNGAVSHIVFILRKVTRTAQLLPFVYLFIYAAFLLLEPYMSDAVFSIADDIACASPASLAVMLLASRVLRLCVWHKAACIIPFSSRVTEYIDNYIITFTQDEIMVINTALGIGVLVFIVAAYRHFFSK